MSIEEILPKYFGCKKVFLKRPRLVGYWVGGRNEYEYMTRSGWKSYGEITSLLYDLEKLLGSDVINANSIIAELDGIISDNQY